MVAQDALRLCYFVDALVSGREISVRRQKVVETSVAAAVAEAAVRSVAQVWNRLCRAFLVRKTCYTLQ